MSRLVVGLDLGTSSYKAAAFDGSARLVAEASALPELIHPRTGWTEQEPANLLSTAALALTRLVDTGIDPRNVEAIGLTGQLGGMVLVDAESQAIGPHEVWLDNRAANERALLVQKHGSEVFANTGMQPFIAPRLQWRANHAEADVLGAAMAVQCWPFVAMNLAGLSGEAGFNDATSIGVFGVADVANGQWSESLVEATGVDARLLPRVVEPWDVVGELTPAWATATGLNPGTPIVAGLGDGIAGWLGCGATEPGIAVDTVGSSDHFGFATDRFVADAQCRVLSTFRSAIPGVWHLFGFTAGSGLTEQWFRKEFAGVGEGQSRGWEALESEAAGVAVGSAGLTCIPHLEGRFCPDQPEVRGVFHGFTWQHTRGHFYRSILESVAYEYAHYLEAARQIDVDTALRSVRVVGGGAKSALWNQIKSDVLGIRYEQLAASNFTCRGAALCAGYASGLYSDLAAAASDGLAVARTFTPNTDRHDAYRPHVEHYRQLLVELQPSFSRGLAIA